MQRPGSIDDPSWREALSRAAACLEGRGRGALLFLEDREDLSVVLDSRSGKLVGDHSRQSGLAVRGPFDGGRELYLAHPEPAHAEALASALLDPNSPLPGRRPPETGVIERRDEPSAPRPGPLLHSLVDRITVLHSAAQVTARWVSFDQSVAVARPDRELVTDRRQGGRVRVEARDGSPGEGFKAVVEAVLPRCPEDLVNPLAEQVVARLDELRQARPVSPMPQPIVFAAGVGGILIHEIIGHALEGDIFCSVRGRSWLAACPAGHAVGSRELVVLDDPRRGRASWRIDDEGERSRPTTLLRHGVVAGPLVDLACALASGRQPTGHGRRSSYREPVMPRMGCTFLAPGRLHPTEVLEGIERGIYVRRLETASTDPATGRAVFRVTDADRIHRGKLDAPLRPHLLRIDAPAALSSLDRIADDLTFDPCVGSCLRDGQPLPVSVGGPTFRIGSTNVLS